MLLVLWKFIILLLTEVDESNRTYSADKAWELTLTRFIERVNASHFSFQARTRRAITRGLTPPKATKLNNALEPIAQIGNDAQLSISPHFHQLASHYLGDRLKLNSQVQIAEPAPASPKPIAFVRASS